ncbi:MAG: hypothetical protein COU65_03215 [Candidatus Pacebacteria bacterium CG10_big_fil_rev_8_21_14_0_10_42_12]|nr:hypothetical protein [Candidatus Paceibacterota bacterium]PIR62482.1 MAG: hypothetical protein COU65_03215 [Candidatus Pacebacteria bacterium CG10_big_fil_rev_8_21_14_0_10_42_12]
MHKTSFALGLAAAAVIGGAFVFTSKGIQAQDVTSDLAPCSGGRGGYEKREEMKTVMENGDFAAWKELAADRPVAANIDTEEKFQKLQQAHQYRMDGNEEAAEAIRDELGLPEHGPRGGGPRDGSGMGRNR